MILSALFCPGRRRPSVALPPPIDVRRLRERWHAARALATTGFMALHAVREHGQLVDFELDNACAAAFRLLRGGTLNLLGQRLAQVLAWHDRRLTVFDHYRRVVELGSARAVTAAVAVDARVDVLRHAAVRTHDGVAVTLTNVSAVRRVLALEREIESRVGSRA